jgi:hypothetical protein
VVERESTKHGPREDEDLARSVEGLVRGAPVDPRSREDRRLEDPGEEGEFEDAVRPDVQGPDYLLDEHELNERAELSRLLTGLAYPAVREDAVAVAERNGAEDADLERLRHLPDGKFDLFEAIWEALGGQPDPPREEAV